MLADDENVAVNFGKSRHDALVDEKLMNLLVVFHGDFFTIAAFPKLSILILHHLIEIPVS